MQETNMPQLFALVPEALLLVVGFTTFVVAVISLTLYVGAESMRPYGGSMGHMTCFLLLPFYGLFRLTNFVFGRHLSVLERQT